MSRLTIGIGSATKARSEVVYIRVQECIYKSAVVIRGRKTLQSPTCPATPR
jgi:hypothetical protein